MNKQELLNKINVLQSKQCAIQAEINQLKEQAEKPNPRWVPCGGEKYYLVTNHGEANYSVWHEYDIDKGRLSIGNVFKTKEEAEFALERLKVIAELKEYSKEFVVCEDNFCIYYDNECGAIDYDFLHWDQSNNLYFPSREIAQQAVEAVGEDRVKKYYLGGEVE